MNLVMLSARSASGHTRAIIAMTLSLMLCSIAGSAHAQNNCGANGNNFYSAYAYSGGVIKMQPVNQDICWLTDLVGWFDGSTQNTQGADVTIHNDGYWYLETYNNSDVGWALCMPAYCFSGASPSDTEVDWDNVEYPRNFWNISALADTSGGDPAQMNCQNSSCNCDQNANGYPGLPGTTAAVTFLQGWPYGPGATNGAGEAAWVTQSNDPNVPSTVAAQTCVRNEPNSGWVHPIFGALFVGSPYTSQPADIWSTGWTTGTYTVDLGINGSQGICFLTYVAGAFRGSEATVYTSWNGSAYEWYGQTQTGNGSQLAANYACMPYITNQ